MILTVVLASNAECLCISLMEAEGGKEKCNFGSTLLFELLTRDGKKRDFQVQNILLSKNCMTMLDLILEPFAISLQLASGSVRGKSLGQPFGDVV